MQKQFHLFIRHHFNDWYTASVLTHPEFAAYGPKQPELREEIRQVLARELAIKRLVPRGQTHFESLRQRSLRLEVKAVQNNRLITVPMRFTILFCELDKETELFEVRIPRISQTFRIVGEENVLPWSEEIIRGYFHLKEVESLLRYQYERNERIETLDVVYHGPGRYKVKKEPSSLEELDEMFRYRSTLEEVGICLSEEAREGRLPRALYREEMTEQLLAILGSGQSRSVLLVGSSGVGKSALVHEVAHRIAHSEKIPDRLLDAPVWHVSGGRIIAGMKYLGQWQERCLAVVEEIRSERGILYVDSLLELLMSGSLQTGLNVAQFLLPYMQSGELTVVAEATPDALSLAEHLNSPFVQAMRKLPVGPLNADKTFLLLEQYARRLGKEHRVDFTRPAISRALDTLARFGDADALPGSGLALLEQMARLTVPTVKRRTLHAVDAIRAFSRSSGFPEALIDPEQLLDPEEVRRFFRERVIGQDHATDLLTNLVLLIKASLNDPQKPLGSFLFMGPTGVGKTESALTLAEYLFADRTRLVRLDMSEYSYPGSSARLVGGGEGEGDLTRKVREQPFCIILLDEMEKADPGVFDVLLQVLGEGRLTDATGQTVRFSHSIVIMTSNLGATRKPALGFAQQTTADLEGHYLDAAEKFFRPEFINRIDFLVPFHDLDRDSLQAIARRMLDKAIAREGFARRGLSLRYGEEILHFLMEAGFDPKYGARPMKRAVEQHVLVPLSRRLVRHHESREKTLELYLHHNRIAVVSSTGLSTMAAALIRELALEHDELWGRYLSDIRRRLDEWEQSLVVRRLRREERLELPQQLSDFSEEVNEVDAFAQRHPSQLQAEERQQLLERAQDLDQRFARLDQALCLEALPGGDEATFFVEARSLHPAALRLAGLLQQEYQQWAQNEGLEVTVEEEEYRTGLHLKGRGAAALLFGEIGLHRLQQQEEDETDELRETDEHHETNEVLLYQDPRPAEGTLPVAREYSSDPPALWDPVTGVEINAPLTELAQHLPRFVLARLCQRVAQLPSTP